MINKPNNSNNRKRNGKRKYYQGFYTVVNKNKYIGNPTNCIYRSKWELYFMSWCDKNTSIKRWSSEHIVIPYQDEKGKFHRYFPDFYIEKIDKNDLEKFEQIIIEIKPKKETKYPKKPKKLTAKTIESYEYQLRMYQKNLYKWTKAINWCNKHKMKFKIVHEDHLKENKIM